MIEVSQGARTRVRGRGSMSLHESVSILAKLRHRSLGEVSEARAAVEVQVIQLAAKRITAPQLARLETLVDEQRSMLDDPVRFEISDQEFHQLLYRACGNDLLAGVVFDFYGYAPEYRRLALKRRNAIARSVDEHQRIIDALRKRDPRAAVAAMSRHLEQVLRTTGAVMGSAARAA